MQLATSWYKKLKNKFFGFKTNALKNVVHDNETKTSSIESLGSTDTGYATRKKMTNIVNETMNDTNKTPSKSKVTNLEILNTAGDEYHSAQVIKDSHQEQAAIIREFREAHPMYDTSYFFFRPNNRLRRFCKRLVTPAKNGQNLFSIAIIISIIISTIILAMDTPMTRKNKLEVELAAYARQTGQSRASLDLMNPEPRLTAILRQSEYLGDTFYYGESVFVAIFTLEFLIRTIADGVILTPNAYLLSGWHWLDVLVLISMLLGLKTNFVDVSGFPRFNRAVRAMRPLRLIPLLPGLRSIFNLLLSSLVSA
jgi:hypothetical protein